MIREALEYLKELGVSSEKPQTIEIGGRQFTNRGLCVVDDASQMSIGLNSLSGIIDYVKSKFDTATHAEALMIHVESPNLVKLYGPLQGANRTRYEYCMTSFHRDGLISGRKYNPEEFNMALQMHVEDKFDRAKLLKLSGTIGCEKSMTSHDDGVTQQVSVRQGAVLEVAEEVPNPVTLSPYRTFAEVEQPESPFVFRVHDNGPDRLPSLALYECDGGIWKNKAMQNIKEYLKEELPAVHVLA